MLCSEAGAEAQQSGWRRGRDQACGQWGALKEQLQRQIKFEMRIHSLQKLFLKRFVSEVFYQKQWLFCIYFVAENRRVQNLMTDNSFVPLSKLLFSVAFFGPFQ